jgi:hypothetical protein
LRRTAAARDEPELMSLFCGQAAALATPAPAAELVDAMIQRLAAVVEALDAIVNRPA